MKLTDLIFWLALLSITTDGASFIIDLVHGPQPKTEKVQTDKQQPKEPSDLKSDW
jgi:hypothetical protein